MRLKKVVKSPCFCWSLFGYHVPTRPCDINIVDPLSVRTSISPSSTSSIHPRHRNASPSGRWLTTFTMLIRFIGHPVRECHHGRDSLHRSRGRRQPAHATSRRTDPHQLNEEGWAQVSPYQQQGGGQQSTSSTPRRRVKALCVDNNECGSPSTQRRRGSQCCYVYI